MTHSVAEKLCIQHLCTHLHSLHSIYNLIHFNFHEINEKLPSFVITFCSRRQQIRESIAGRLHFQLSLINQFFFVVVVDWSGRQVDSIPGRCLIYYYVYRIVSSIFVGPIWGHQSDFWFQFIFEMPWIGPVSVCLCRSGFSHFRVFEEWFY